MYYEDVRARTGKRHRREALVDVVRDFLIKARIDYNTRADEQQRVSVGCRVRDHRHSKIAARARMVLDIELLAQTVAQFLRDQARHRVGRARRSEGYNDLDRPSRITRGVLSLCGKPGE